MKNPNKKTKHKNFLTSINKPKKIKKIIKLAKLHKNINNKTLTPINNTIDLFFSQFEKKPQKKSPPIEKTPEVVESVMNIEDVVRALQEKFAPVK